MPDRANGGRSWKDSPWLGLLPSALAFLIMAVISWRKWPDPIIDFGGQLYIPWQLSTGSVLYRDVMYLPGPLSPYYHALLFKLFGVSFSAIIVSNLVILSGFILLVYRLFLDCTDRMTAGAIALSVVVGFAFAQYLDVGNYNYLAPYSHEIWHGIVLGVLLIACAAKWLKARADLQGADGARSSGRFNAEQASGRAPGAWLFLAGLCYGLIFLAKPENFLAATAVVIGIFLLTPRKSAALKPWLGFVVATILPLLGYFFLFFTHENVSNSIRGVCGAWVPLVTTHMASGSFFKAGMGFDVPFFHLRWMLQHFVVLAGIVGLCAWRLRANQNRIERLVLICVLAGLAINFDWTHCGRSLPLIVVSALAGLLILWKREPVVAREKLIVPILWLLLALFLLPKMGLFPRISHYGVFLAMPAFLGAVYFIIYLLPGLFPTRIDAKPFRPAMLLLLGIGLVRLAIHSALFYHDKDFSVGEGGDRIVTYGAKIAPQGEGVARAVAWLKTNAAPNATVAALPEGAMINYLSRHPNPSPYIVFMSEIYAFGEEKMAAPYRASPPDYILLIHRDTGEYGLDFFGKKKGYGLDMLVWINANYVAVELIGAEPLQNDKFGIKILKRKI